MNSLKSFLNGFNSKSVNNKSLLFLLLFLLGLLLKFSICLFVTEVDLIEVFSFFPVVFLLLRSCLVFGI